MKTTTYTCTNCRCQVTRKTEIEPGENCPDCKKAAIIFLLPNLTVAQIRHMIDSDEYQRLTTTRKLLYWLDEIYERTMNFIGA